jgi:hypothetical protein
MIVSYQVYKVYKVCKVLLDKLYELDNLMNFRLICKAGVNENLIIAFVYISRFFVIPSLAGDLACRMARETSCHPTRNEIPRETRDDGQISSG